MSEFPPSSSNASSNIMNYLGNQEISQTANIGQAVDCPLKKLQSEVSVSELNDNDKANELQNPFHLDETIKQIARQEPVQLTDSSASCELLICSGKPNLQLAENNENGKPKIFETIDVGKALDRTYTPFVNKSNNISEKDEFSNNSLVDGVIKVKQEDGGSVSFTHTDISNVRLNPFAVNEILVKTKHIKCETSELDDPLIGKSDCNNCAHVMEYRSKFLESHSEDSEEDSSSSDSEESSSSDTVTSSESEISEIETELDREPTPGKPKPPMTKGELDLKDLPPIEDLHITVPKSECQEMGYVSSIVDELVVVQSLPNNPAADLDSILFLDEGQRALGKVFDVFGPVTDPCYAIRFNSLQHIQEKRIEKGMKVYFAPKTPHMNFVFISELMKMKGSDASWEDNNEPPSNHIEYSDDEAEREARKKTDKFQNRNPYESQRKKFNTGRQNQQAYRPQHQRSFNRNNGRQDTQENYNISPWLGTPSPNNASNPRFSQYGASNSRFNSPIYPYNARNQFSANTPSYPCPPSSPSLSPFGNRPVISSPHPRAVGSLYFPNTNVTHGFSRPPVFSNQTARLHPSYPYSRPPASMLTPPFDPSKPPPKY